MKTKTLSGVARYLFWVPLLLLGGCNMHHFWILNPHGVTTGAETHYLVIDVVVLTIVILPTLLLLLAVMWRYRRSAGAQYAPKWSHSNVLEVIVWGIPLIAVGILAYFSWEGTHAVNPWHPTVIKGESAQAQKPLDIQVYTTDWQWLFVYPKQKIAVSNELVVPANRRVNFELTSASVTNDFFVPNLVGQIYVMPGMRTRQSLLAPRPGDYHAFSAEFSGPGFAYMNYTVKVVKPKAFDQWVAGVQKQASQKLDYVTFKQFAKPTVNVANQVQTFAVVDPDLFRQVVTAVRSDQLRYKTPLYLTDDMKAKLFKSHAD